VLSSARAEGLPVSSTLYRRLCIQVFKPCEIFWFA
jgi:hypothetical protein